MGWLQRDTKATPSKWVAPKTDISRFFPMCAAMGRHGAFSASLEEGSAGRCLPRETPFVPSSFLPFLCVFSCFFSSYCLSAFSFLQTLLVSFPLSFFGPHHSAAFVFFLFVSFSPCVVSCFAIHSFFCLYPLDLLVLFSSPFFRVVFPCRIASFILFSSFLIISLFYIVIQSSLVRSDPF